jgi:hypothetical protein
VMKSAIKWVMTFAGLFTLSLFGLQNTFASDTNALVLEFVNNPAMPIDAKGTDFKIFSIKNNVHDEGFTFTVKASAKNTHYATLHIRPLENNENACPHVANKLNEFTISPNQTCEIGVYIIASGNESSTVLKDTLTLDYGGITFPYVDVTYHASPAVFHSSNGPDGGSIYAVILQNNSATNNTQTLYAGGAGGVFISTDQGANWSALNNGFSPNTNVTALTLSDDNIVYAVAAVSSGPNIVYQLINNEWQAIAPNTNTNFVGITSLWVSPENQLLAGADAGLGLHWWDGTSWAYVHNNLIIGDIITNPSGGAYVGVMNSYPTNNNLLGVHTWDTTNATLTQIPQTAGTPILSLLYDAHNATLYAGGYNTGVFSLYTSNNVTYWQSIGSYTNAIGLALDDAHSLYIAAEFQGFYKLSGSQWSVLNNNLPNYAIRGFYGLINDEENLYTFYAYPWSGGFGVYKTEMDSISWTAVNTGLTQTSVDSLAIDENNHVYAASFLSGPFQLNDNTWTSMAQNDQTAIYTARVEIGENQTVYITNPNNNGILKWNGTDWESLGFTAPLITSLAIIDDNNLYIGSINSLYHWDGSNLVAINPPHTHYHITSLDIDTSVSPHMLYAGVGYGSTDPMGVYTHTIGGTDFVLIPQTTHYPINDLTIYTPFNASSIIFASSGGISLPGVWTWDKNSWTAISSLYGNYIGAIAIDSLGTLYSSGESNVLDVSGVFVTPYHKDSYFVTEDFFNSNIFDIAIDSNNNVYVGTDGAGVYTLRP